ncbi:hypothetical protein BD410DRAFT_516933 [Rickenella mellea]|uniref:Uncharacterized protein n=1 Tax=Rickenella mellea TaxID=50990 RepID=A0A4Y7QGL5_9AGAM|nr:hypothetical protein BD410DRAFT_516933 [Rickenella mellea]
MDFDPKGVAVSLVGFSMAMVGLIASIIAPAFNYIPSMRPQMPPMVTRPPPPRQIASQRHSLVHSSTSGGSAGASASDTASSSSSAVNDVPQQDQLTFHAGEEKSTTPSERDTFHSSSAPPIAYTGSRIKPYPLELQRRSLDSEHDRAIFSERKGPLPDFARSPQSSHSSHVTILAPSTRKPVRSVSSPASSVQRRSSPTPRSNLSYPPIEPETFETSNAEAEASGSALLRSKSTPGEQCGLWILLLKNKLLNNNFSTHQREAKSKTNL